MTRDEFLRRVNGEAETLGLPKVTGGILYDWLEAKIIEAPEKRGRVRDWTESHMERAAHILCLKSQGVENLCDIRFHLWLDDPDIPLFEFGFRGNLSREFGPLKNKLFRQIRSTYPENRNPAPDSFSAKSVLGKLGPLDPCFGPWIEYTPEELLDAYTLLRFGHSKNHLDQVLARLRPKISAQLVVIFKQAFPRIPAPIIRAAISAIPHRAFSKVIRLFYLDGMTETIFDASVSEFLLARRALNASVILFRCMGLQKVSDSLQHPAWQTPMFVLLLQVVRRAKGTPFEIEPEVFDFFEKKPAFSR